jgi:hypothetical protein
VTVYTIALTIGAVGLATMAFGGLGRHGAHAGHSHGHGLRLGGRGAGRVTAARGGRLTRETAGNALAALASPRVLLSLCVGFGATGAILGHVLAGPALAGSAILGALGFERLIVAPMWRWMMRFAGEPAKTLESCIADEVSAVTAFDRDGNGLVAVELDGQVTHVLATLRAEDRNAGALVHAGDKLRIEDVDPQHNRCTVSLLWTRTTS